MPVNANYKWSTGKLPSQSFGSGGSTIEQDSAFNEFGFNELGFNEVVITGTGGQTAIPVTGKGVSVPLWKYAKGEPI